MTKVGSGGRPWVVLEKPRPPAVDEVETYWIIPPPVASERCRYWLRQIGRGWRPNRRWSAEGYYGASELYGVYIWEYLNMIRPTLDALDG